jgi:hypothetical protein
MIDCKIDCRIKVHSLAEKYDSELQRVNRVLIQRRFEQPRDPNDKMIHSPQSMECMLRFNYPVLHIVDGMEDAVRLDMRELDPISAMSM